MIPQLHSAIVLLRRGHTANAGEGIMGNEEEQKGKKNIRFIRLLTWLLVGCVSLFFAFCLLDRIIPSFIIHRKHLKHSAAIHSLKAISRAQSLFREMDRNNDGKLDYATCIKDLSTYQLIDPALGSGTKDGYIFSITRSSASHIFQWNCTAKPMKSGYWYFYIDDRGVIRFETKHMADHCSPAYSR